MLKGLETDHYTPEETNDFILENNILNFDFDIKKLNEEEYEKVKNQSKLMSSSIDFQE
jgi:outer membrane protein OmpA-like peptidoglycan-associated protein